jgi:stage V sporulation protein R
MNEGCATFVHYTIMNALFDQGRISEGAMLEILRNHANVIFQPGFDDPSFSGINPYALGLDMMQDIRRIATSPRQRTATGSPRLPGRGTGAGFCSTPGPITATSPSSASISARP